MTMKPLALVKTAPDMVKSMLLVASFLMMAFSFWGHNQIMMTQHTLEDLDFLPLPLSAATSKQQSSHLQPVVGTGKTAIALVNQAIIPQFNRKIAHPKQQTNQTAALAIKQVGASKLDQSVAALLFSPHCKQFTDFPQVTQIEQDVPHFISDFVQEHYQMIRNGNFPITRFTPHVNSILELIDLEEVEKYCTPQYIFTVPESYSEPTHIFCTEEDKRISVKSWCNILRRLFQDELEVQWLPFSPILPTNVTLSISRGDFNKDFSCGKDPRTYAKLANSSPNATFSVTTFLEVKRMADRRAYPIVPWEQRCSIPIWRGTAWMTGRRQVLGGLEDVLQRSSRLRTVHFSHHHPGLVDARISHKTQGALSPKSFDQNHELWQNNATNGLHQLLPVHSIPRTEYFTHYQTMLVLCGIGAAFRTPIHLSTATAVMYQECKYLEWYQPMMVPWKHYIPLNQSLDDLQDKLEWVRDHPQEVYEIAQNGRQFYEDYLSFGRNYEHFYELVYRLALLKLEKERKGSNYKYSRRFGML